MPFSDGLVTNIAETLGNPSYTTVINRQMLGSSVITAQSDTKPPKATYNNQETNQSLGNETHPLDTNKKHFDMIRMIYVTSLPCNLT